jgi:deoxyribodipyrimidine photo-lyase
MVMIENSRLQVYRSGAPASGRYVLYWMQQAQRSRCNHALEWAVDVALACKLPLLVAFVLTDSFPEANCRHYAFMLEGLHDVADDLAQRGIAFTVHKGDPPAVVTALSQSAAMLVGDVGYLRIQRQWRESVAKQIRCPFTAVETDVVVPVTLASGKEEYAARTIRPKLNKLRERFLKPLLPSATDALLAFDEMTMMHAIPGLETLDLDRSVAPVSGFRGGQNAATSTLATFIRDKLPVYHIARNDPSERICSDMSPYLHFGQLSPLDVALQIQASGAPEAAIEAYLEELIVRRELSMNFVYFNPRYDSYEALPAWARKTLDLHRHDPRDTVYSRQALEHATTHDPYWNAAQTEMVTTGKMHNYMRMYWGKKVIEWSDSPEKAFDTLLYLNNKYELDGRDANSFTGIAWCFGKHDRPWKERPIFGTVRYMAASGLKRKFNIDAYCSRFSNPPCA